MTISMKAVRSPKKTYYCGICERRIVGEHIYAFGGEQYGKPRSLRVCANCSLSDVVTDEWREFAETHLTSRAPESPLAPINQLDPVPESSPVSPVGSPALR